jgi:hypothetical protein
MGAGPFCSGERLQPLAIAAASEQSLNQQTARRRVALTEYRPVLLFIRISVLEVSSPQAR